MELNERLLSDVVGVVRDASRQVMAFYQGVGGCGVQQKSDRSPVTEADLVADKLLRAALKEIAPALPVLSEESAVPAYRLRKSWEQYWLVDPLDGTRGFIDGNGQFTVNVALIEAGEPVLGVVGLPAQDTVYAAARNIGAFEYKAGARALLSTRRLGEGSQVTLACSFRRSSPQQEQMVRLLESGGYSVDYVRTGSAIKLCRVAEGVADFYPCFLATSEWDIAAGQAIVEQAGGVVINLETMDAMRYNQKASLKNPSFLVVGDPDFDWQQYLSC